MTDTIVALSSGHPPAAIGVVRISGPGALAIVAAVSGKPPPPRIAALRALRDAEGALLDRALVLVFPGPRSATGEDLVEFHCHGGRAVVTAVEAALVAAGCRRAAAGEFTRRALANGRIDLAEAEGLADLLAAETEAQRVAALGAAEGRISQQVDAWMRALSDLSARVEALIDHDDEDDVATGDHVVAAIVRDAAALGHEIAVAVAAPPVERLRDGLRVVIAGPPNAGKSTLLNLMSGREAAIVSPIAGTTRDRVEAPVRRGDHAFLLTDTAGLTVSDDAVEMIGVARAEAAIAGADILLWLGDGVPPRPDALRVHARADLPDREAAPEGKVAIRRDQPATIDALWTRVASVASDLLPRADMLPWRRWQQEQCRDVAALLSIDSDDPLLVAEACRLARTQLGALLGIDATEAMLDALFSRFCIGK